MRTRKPLAVLGLVAVLLLGACGDKKASDDTDSSGKDGPAPTEETASPEPEPTAQEAAGACPKAQLPAVKAENPLAKPGNALDPNKHYRAEMATSCGGDAAVDTNNFVYLARAKFFDGSIFLHGLEGFVIQGGDPLGLDPERAGTGGPGYSYTGSVPTSSGPKAYALGDLVMANAGDPSSNGSQFFVVAGPSGEQLPPNYSRFGTMVSGQDVLAKIVAGPVRSSPEGYPVDPVVIQGVTITES